MRKRPKPCHRRGPFPPGRARVPRALICLLLLHFSFFIQTAPAQIQQAWVARYNNSILDGTNQAVKMALDTNGNIYVTGFSQNTNTNLGYVTLKYAPNGNQLWAARLDSTNYPTATPSGLVLDTSNNVVVTGNALTVKYDSSGNELWISPYNGNSIAIDPGGNAIVTGVASNFTTVKLSPKGSNLWQTTYIEPLGPVWSQVALVDSSSNVYVAGSDTYVCFSTVCYQQLLIVKYDRNGNQVWSAGNNQGGAPVRSVQVGGLALDGNENIYAVADFVGVQSYVLFKYNPSGDLMWTSFLDQSASSTVVALAVDRNSSVIFTGQIPYKYTGYLSFMYGSYKVDASGSPVWTNDYPNLPFGSSGATSLAVDPANNSDITGYSPSSNGTNDIVTIKYDPNGNQVWLQRYSSPSGGNAAGNAIAVDNNGNVYVSGYDTTAQGGTEIVTIKYSPVTLQRQPNGTVILQSQGSPGEAFDIEASADLLNWLDLGTVQADTNGLLQFDDTNAPNFPSRFYHTTPQ